MNASVGASQTAQVGEGCSQQVCKWQLLLHPAPTLTYQSLHEVVQWSMCRPPCQGEGDQGEESGGAVKQQQLIIVGEDAIYAHEQNRQCVVSLKDDLTGCQE